MSYPEPLPNHHSILGSSSFPGLSQPPQGAQSFPGLISFPALSHPSSQTVPGAQSVCCSSSYPGLSHYSSYIGMESFFGDGVGLQQPGLVLSAWFERVWQVSSLVDHELVESW